MKYLRDNVLKRHETDSKGRMYRYYITIGVYRFWFSRRRVQNISTLPARAHRTQCEDIIKSKNILSSDFCAYNIPIIQVGTRRRRGEGFVIDVCGGRIYRHNHTINLYITIPHIDQRTDVVL